MLIARSCWFFNRQWRELLFSWFAVWTLALIVIHQSLIAGSAYFLTRMIDNFQKNGDYRFYLIGYMASMLLPYLPGCVSYATLQKWVNQSHSRYVDRFAAAAYGATEKYRDMEARRNNGTIVSRNSFIVIKDYLSFLHSFFGFFLNSFLSMLVLGVLLPGQLLLGYFSSVLLCIVIILCTRKWMARMAAETEKEFISYSGFLERMWDNTTLGNKYNFALWLNKKLQFGERYYAQSSRLELSRQMGNLMLACVSLGPSIYLIFHLLFSPSSEPALMAAVIVNLTRIFHILNSLSTLVYQLLDWSSMNARLGIVFNIESSISSHSVPWPTASGKIVINGIPVRSFQDAMDLIANKSNGRWTIKGENGAGKSTLLQFVKKRLGDQAMLLPADSANLVWRTDSEQRSTGQSALMRIHEAISASTVKAILLDEWDANLDEKNTQSVDQLLDSLSKTRIVIEIRH